MSFALASARTGSTELICTLDQATYDAFFKINKKIYQRFGQTTIKIDDGNTINFTCGLVETLIKLTLGFLGELRLPTIEYQLNKKNVAKLESMNVGNEIDILRLRNSNGITFTDHHLRALDIIDAIGAEAQTLNLKEEELRPVTDALELGNISRLFKPYNKFKRIKIFTYIDTILAIAHNSGEYNIFHPADRELLSDPECKIYISNWIQKLYGKEGYLQIYTDDRNIFYLRANIEMPMLVSCEFWEELTQGVTK